MSLQVRTTPFHPRLAELNTQGLYTHWQGYLSALRYTSAPKNEYFAVRNSVGIFDSSPLWKYAVTGPDAERLLAGMLVRDIRRCRPGQAHYTAWCDDHGFVLEDGVVLRRATDDFLFTTARPNLAYLRALAGRLRVEVEDVSQAYAVLAVQGPRSRAVLTALDEGLPALGYFHHAETKLASHPVLLSRSGYTGDLGFELFVPADSALAVLDAVLEAGDDHGLRPFGEEALMTLRIEAGLPLYGLDFTSSRLAETDADRFTPTELGLGWLLQGIDRDDRPFVGRGAIRRELASGSSRWATVGVSVNPADWVRIHRDRGLLPRYDEHQLGYESLLWSQGPGNVEPAGYVTSLAYSPVLQRHVGLARVRPGLAAVGTPLRLETSLAHETTTVLAHTTSLPHFDPERRRR